MGTYYWAPRKTKCPDPIPQSVGVPVSSTLLASYHSLKKYFGKGLDRQEARRCCTPSWIWGVNCMQTTKHASTGSKLVWNLQPCHRKSKTEVLMAPRKGLTSSKIWRNVWQIGISQTMALVAVIVRRACFMSNTELLSLRWCLRP